MLNSQSVHQVARNTSGCEAKQENNEQMKVKASFVCMQKKKKKGVVTRKSGTNRVMQKIVSVIVERNCF